MIEQPKRECVRRIVRSEKIGDVTIGTASAAEKLDRRWLAFERDRTYLAASAFRFVDELPVEELTMIWSRLRSDDLPVEVSRQQRELGFREERATPGLNCLPPKRSPESF